METTHTTNHESHGHPTHSKNGEKNMLMGILAYLGPLVLIPFLTTKNDTFVQYHVKQGFVLLAIEIGVWILGMILGMSLFYLWPIVSLINLGTIVLSILGIVNVVNGQEKELPLVGKFSSHIKI